MRNLEGHDIGEDWWGVGPKSVVLTFLPDVSSHSWLSVAVKFIRHTYVSQPLACKCNVTLLESSGSGKSRLSYVLPKALVKHFWVCLSTLIQGFGSVSGPWSPILGNCFQHIVHLFTMRWTAFLCQNLPPLCFCLGATQPLETVSQINFFSFKLLVLSNSPQWQENGQYRKLVSEKWTHCF